MVVWASYLQANEREAGDEVRLVGKNIRPSGDHRRMAAQSGGLRPDSASLFPRVFESIRDEPL